MKFSLGVVDCLLIDMSLLVLTGIEQTVGGYAVYEPRPAVGNGVNGSTGRL
jgi:hypothetical protein